MCVLQKDKKKKYVGGCTVRCGGRGASEGPMPRHRFPLRDQSHDGVAYNRVYLGHGQGS